VVDDSFLLVVHSGHLPADFVLPGGRWAEGYEPVLDTAADAPWEAGGGTVPSGQVVRVAARSVRLYRVREVRAAESPGRG
jgi:glycogen operon protein